MSFLMLDFLMVGLKLRIPDDRVKNKDFMMTGLNLRFLMTWLKLNIS
jgi:hypothetical protein